MLPAVVPSSAESATARGGPSKTPQPAVAELKPLEAQNRFNKAFADFIRIPAHVVARNVFHRPRGLPLERAALRIEVWQDNGNTLLDQEAALAQGINVGRVFAISWGVGAAIAALSGIFASMAPWGPAGVVNREGALFVFRALPAVVLGGLDSVVGALMGGLIIGFAEVFAGQYLADHASILGYGYQQVVPYVVMLIGLLIRPYGMFGTAEVRRV